MSTFLPRASVRRRENLIIDIQEILLLQMKKMSHAFYDFQLRTRNLGCKNPNVIRVNDRVVFTVQEDGFALYFAHIDGLA